MKDGEAMAFWDELIEPVFGYIAWLLVIGVSLIVVYVLVLVTFAIRKLLLPELGFPNISWKAHKFFWMLVGIVFLAGVLLFATAFIPAVVALYLIYLVIRYVMPIIGGMTLGAVKDIKR